MDPNPQLTLGPVADPDRDQFGCYAAGADPNPFSFSDPESSSVSDTDLDSVSAPDIKQDTDVSCSITT